MKIEVIEKTQDLTFLGLDGRLDLAGVQEIQNQFYGHTAARKKATIIDMSRVTFLASLGIRMLVEAAKGLKAAGAKIVLLNPQELVEKSLRSSGLDTVLAMTHNVDEARKLVLG
jgi:anti-anti-sigma factor